MCLRTASAVARHPVVYLTHLRLLTDRLRKAFSTPAPNSSPLRQPGDRSGNVAHYTGSEYFCSPVQQRTPYPRSVTGSVERGISAIMDRVDKLPPKGRVSISAHSRRALLQEIKLAVITEDQLIVSFHRPRKKPRGHMSFTDLAPGDLVVIHHGIGRFVKMEKITPGRINATI